MANKLTTWLLIALILTLPLRAVAAVAVAHCPMESASAAQSAMHGADEMEAMHCHGMDHGEQDGPRQPNPHAQGSCGHCADCCVGAFSLPASFRLPVPDQPVSTVIPLFERAYAGFQPEGPERPPRSSAP